MRIKKYVKAESPEEAFGILEKNAKAAVIAGGAWLKLLPVEIDEAVDISALGLEGITESNGYIEIGSMTTLRQIETSKSLAKLYDGIIPCAAEKIMGMGIRNIATIGGTISGKYGFSDLITPLMVVGTELEFYKRGTVSLAEYMGKTSKVNDLLMWIRIPVKDGRGWYETMKITAIDFPILNAAVSRIDGRAFIAVGSRPYKAELAEKAMAYLETCEDPERDCIEMAAVTAAAELKFGSNTRGSAEYRKQLCEALVKRGLEEVLS